VEALTLDRAGARSRSARHYGTLGLPGWLLVLLVAICGIAAFTNGGVGIPEESRLQVVIAGTLLLMGLGLSTGVMRLPQAPMAWAAIVLLLAFALWSALSVEWSSAPDQSWLAANRGAAYVTAIGVALVAAASFRSAPALTAIGFTAAITIVALYALGGKLAPGVDLPGLNLNHTSEYTRLREPIGYWNGLGLLCVMGMPACIWLAADREYQRRARIAAALIFTVLIVTATLTYSRGALVAAMVVVAVLVAAGPDRLRRLGVAILGTIAATPALTLAFSRPDLTGDRVPLDQRTDDGALLAVVLVLSLLALAAFAWLVIRAEGRVRWRRRHSRRIVRILVGLVVIWLGLGFAASTSERGLTETLSDEWREFKSVKQAQDTSPGRLFSSNGSNRWPWWSEAVGSFWDRPLQGWGAGSFPTVHYLYRENTPPVQSAHSVPLQTLSETGLVGGALAISGMALLLGAAVAGVRRSSGPDRSARIALTAMAIAWTVHSLYDWDWEIPAVTLPALIAAAVAAAPLTRPKPASFIRVGQVPSARPLRVAIATAVGVAFAASAAMPAVAENRRLASLLVAGGDAGSLNRAALEASTAHRLNPLSIEPILAAASIAINRGQTEKATELLLEAARIEPDNFRAWERLAELALGLGDDALVGAASVEWRRTDPLVFREEPPVEASGFFLVEVPPSTSPTAYGTPVLARRRSPPAAPPQTGE
jgi:O-antigen ligase/polysaccharide polymerase Wzy-like membrane protein